MNEENIEAAKVKAAYKKFGSDHFVEICLFYNRQNQSHEFRVRWPEARYVRPEIATRFAAILEKALQHLNVLQARRARENRFLKSDFDLIELI
jgi:hypothetical protein